MDIGIIIICVVGGYLFGSISFARIITKIVAPDGKLESVEVPDLNTGGTVQLKTVGATTASMVLGAKFGGMIGILDIFKGFIPTLILRLVFPEDPYFLFLGGAIVVGHIWPIYYRFRGGGGLSTALGTLLVLDPLGILICVILSFVIGMFILRDLPMIVLGGPILFIIWTAVRSGNWFYIFYSIFLNLVMFLAIIPDIRGYLKARKEGKVDMVNTMEYIPMGQMMKKMMDKMGLSDNKKGEKK